MSLRDRRYTEALNEFGSEGWELVNVVSETVPARVAERRGRGFPVPRAIGRLEDAADKLTKLGASEETGDGEPTTRLLWVFRRPLDDG